MTEFCAIPFDPEPIEAIPVLEGPPGPPGPAAGYTLARQAEIALSGHRVVKARPGGLSNYPDIDAPADAWLIEGVTTGAAAAGDAVSVQAAGELVESTWSWALGPVYCGPSGQLTQTVPHGAWLRQVGTAVAPDTLLINLFPPILTA